MEQSTFVKGSLRNVKIPLVDRHLKKAGEVQRSKRYDNNKDESIFLNEINFYFLSISPSGNIYRCEMIISKLNIFETLNFTIQAKIRIM